MIELAIVFAISIGGAFLYKLFESTMDVKDIEIVKLCSLHSWSLDHLGEMMCMNCNKKAGE